MIAYRSRCHCRCKIFPSASRSSFPSTSSNSNSTPWRLVILIESNPHLAVVALGRGCSLYVVEAKDTLSGLALRFDMTVANGASHRRRYITLSHSRGSRCLVSCASSLRGALGIGAEKAEPLERQPTLRWPGAHRQVTHTHHRHYHLVFHHAGC